MPHVAPSAQAADLTTVLGKAVTILRAFEYEDPVLSLAEIVRRTGIHKATAHRLTIALVDNGLLERSESNYRLSLGVFELGTRTSHGQSFVEVARPFLQDLYERTHEMVHLGVLDHAEVLYLTKIGGHRQAAAPSRTGGRMPLHCTAIGKVLLAFGGDALRDRVFEGPLQRRTPRTITAEGLLRRQLDAVTASGVAFEREESRLGITCVAAPIIDGDRLAAVSMTGPTSRFRPELHAAAVRATAAALSKTTMHGHRRA